MLELVGEIQELMEVEARQALDSGWAEVRLEEGEIGPSLHLEPVKLASAPLDVYFDSEELVVCSPGRKDMSCEFFSQDTGEIKERVRVLVAAVVAGNYVERMRTGTSGSSSRTPVPGRRPSGSRRKIPRT